MVDYSEFSAVKMFEKANSHKKAMKVWEFLSPLGRRLIIEHFDGLFGRWDEGAEDYYHLRELGLPVADFKTFRKMIDLKNNKFKVFSNSKQKKDNGMKPIKEVEHEYEELRKRQKV